MAKFITLDVFLFLVLVACIATFVTTWKSMRSKESEKKNGRRNKRKRN